MGFYDMRCGVSGLSTRAAKVRLILLREEPAGLVPVALPVTGTYDRLGSIDNIQPTWNTDLLLFGLQALIRDGKITIHWDAFSKRTAPLGTLEQVLSPIERGCTMDITTVTCEGRPLRFTLVIDRIYDAVVDTVASNRTARWAEVQDAALATLPLRDLLERAFHGVAPAPALYELLGAATEEEEARARADLVRFIQFRAFIDQRHRFTYDAEARQHFDDDERAFVAEANERFALQPHILTAIKACAAQFFAIWL